jgi:hypothetical protein
MGDTEDRRPDLPTGTVTFLFTDIEGSIRLLQDLVDRYGAVRDQQAEARAHLSPDAADRAWREGRASGVDAAG